LHVPAQIEHVGDMVEIALGLGGFSTKI